jgi:phosphopantetheinyl transferase
MGLKPETNRSTHRDAPGPEAVCFYAWRKIDGIPAAATRQERVGTGAREARLLCAALLAKVTSSDTSEWRISPPGKGRPSVRSAAPGRVPPRISLSHSGDCVAAAASWHGDPGIDVQVMDRDRDYVALAAYMGWGDSRSWRHGSRFTRTWTQWECWIKAMAGPLPVDPAGFHQALAQDQAARELDTRSGCFRTLQTPGGWLSLALARNRRLVAGIRFRRVSESQLQAMSR